MVTGLAGVLIGRRLKDGHTDCALDKRFRLPGMDKLGFEVFVNFGHHEFLLNGIGTLLYLDVFIRQLLNKCVRFLKEHGYLFSGMKKRIRVGQLMARVKAGGKALENLSITSPA
jgi:hypothetical protein